MKTANSELDAFFASAKEIWSVDLYRFTLLDGTVLRFASGGVPVTWDGFAWQAAGPLLSRASIKCERGMTASSMTVTINADTTDLLLGIPWLQAIRNGALDGARLLLLHGYAAAPGQSLVGVLHGFEGRVGDIDADWVEARVEIKSDQELFDTQIPIHVYQSGCRFSIYSTGCGVSRAAFQSATTVGVGSSATVLKTGLTQPAGYFSGGKIYVTSGQNAGAQRTIKAHSADGTLTLAYPLPGDPVVGDAFQLWPGCDHTKATCAGKFSNVIRFAGQPYIPAAVTTT